LLESFERDDNHFNLIIFRLESPSRGSYQQLTKAPEKLITGYYHQAQKLISVAGPFLKYVPAFQTAWAIISSSRVHGT
jgi:hypothetical protein